VFVHNVLVLFTGYLISRTYIVFYHCFLANKGCQKSFVFVFRSHCAANSTWGKQRLRHMTVIITSFFAAKCEHFTAKKLVIITVMWRSLCLPHVLLAAQCERNTSTNNLWKPLFTKKQMAKHNTSTRN